MVIVIAGFAHLTSSRRRWYGGPRFHQQWHVLGGLWGIAGLFTTIDLTGVWSEWYSFGSQLRGREPLQVLIRVDQ